MIEIFTECIAPQVRRIPETEFLVDGDPGRHLIEIAVEEDGFLLRLPEEDARLLWEALGSQVANGDAATGG